MRKPFPEARAPRRRALAALLLAGAVLWTLGCATTEEIRSIVESSNAQLLSTNALLVNPLQTPSEALKAGDWQAEVARIDTAIESDPGPVTVNALRLRQAMLLTVHRQDSLALATFDLIDSGQLHSDRDKALYAVHEHLVWWFKASVKPLDTEQVEKGKAALAKFDEVNDSLAATSEIRAYLEEMRAWIALAMAKAVPTDAEARELFKAGLDRFASIVSPEDVAWIKAWLADQRDAGDVANRAPRAVRLRLRASKVVREYRQAAKEFDTEWGQAAQPLLAAVPEQPDVP